MKTVIIIAEGMDPVVLEKEIEKGNLPWMAEKKQAGNYRRLDCGPVPYEPSNLATVFSGVNPGKHGCFSYWETHYKDKWPKILDAGDLHATRIWEWEHLKDISFNVVNVQLTHPPQPINGKMISYLMNNSLNASYPRKLISDLHKEGIKYAHDVSLFYTGGSFDEFASEAWRIANYQLETALKLAEDTDVLIVNLTLPDRLSHFMWYEMRNESVGFRPNILRSYDFIDAACQKFEALAPDNLFVFSEIGFGELDEFVSLNNYLQEAGLQKLNSEGNVDIENSIALETVQGSHGVMLTADLNNTGKADPSVLNDVTQALKEMKFPDGTPVLSEVSRREDIYHGDKIFLAPSIIVKPYDEKRPPLGDPRWAGHVSRNTQSAWHRDQGFLIYDGRHNFQPDVGEVKLQQIAASITTTLGREALEQCEMEGILQ